MVDWKHFASFAVLTVVFVCHVASFEDTPGLRGMLLRNNIRVRRSHHDTKHHKRGIDSILVDYSLEQDKDKGGNNGAWAAKYKKGGAGGGAGGSGGSSSSGGSRSSGGSSSSGGSKSKYSGPIDSILESDERRRRDDNQFAKRGIDSILVDYSLEQDKDKGGNNGAWAAKYKKGGAGGSGGSSSSGGSRSSGGSSSSGGSKSKGAPKFDAQGNKIKYDSILEDSDER